MCLFLENLQLLVEKVDEFRLQTLHVVEIVDYSREFDLLCVRPTDGVDRETEGVSQVLEVTCVLPSHLIDQGVGL